MQRIAVVGSSGSGKTTVARAISSGFGIPHLELDSVFHQPGWTPLPTDDFQTAVRGFTDQEAWVVDGNYTSQGIVDVVWPRADTVVWLDLSRTQTLRRVTNRTVRRFVRREQLWNGNKEGWRNFLDPRPENNVILWSWTHHARVREQYDARFKDPRWSDLELVHLTSQPEIDGFLSTLPSS